MADLDDHNTKELNILLLGESGVGKSTFINSCVNYLKYPGLRSALDNELEVLIPAKFEITDANFEQKVVEIGRNQDRNECLEAGKAATQNVKTYIFPMEIAGQKYKVRLLDTPGMGDERGTAQDQKNCELILAYLSQLKEVHAFCLLMKPNNARLDVFMNYCILQILSRLETSAVNNVIFVFTNSRGENFTPGKTFTPLKVLIGKIRQENNINIPLSRMNMFCFDNEPFRYAAALKMGVELEDFIYGATESSWNHSASEIWRMLLYITNLTPHDLKKTISVNDAKVMATQLSRPATEIIQLIDDNLRLLEQHSKDLSEAKLTKEELSKKMYTPKIDITVRDLSSPNTVCTHSNCVRVYEVNGIRKTHFKQKCCKGLGNGCLVTFVGAETVGHPSLWICSAFNVFGSCKLCEHSLKVHQHIYYETEVYEQKVDESMAPAVNSQEEMVRAKEELLNSLQQRQSEFEYERQYILESCVVFGRYLKKNSITPIGNPAEEYLKCEIMRQSAFSTGAGDQTMEQLQNLLADYEREKQNLKKGTGEDGDYTPEDIEERKRTLLTLKHFGAKIQHLFDMHQSSLQNDFKNREIPVSASSGGWFTKMKDIGSAAVKKVLDMGVPYVKSPTEFEKKRNEIIEKLHIA